VAQRRRRSVEEKRRIVEQTLEAGASVARVARAHGVNANQLFSWRRQYQQGLLERGGNETPGLLAVRVVEAATREAAGSRSAQTQRTPSGVIHIEFPKGHLCIAGRVDTEALRVVLEKLLG
jgi:transposase